MMRAVAFAIALLTITPSPSTLAAVAVFAANAERKWPADDSEPFVTAETLRLLEAAGRAIAADEKADTGKVHESLAALAAARAALEKEAGDAAGRPRVEHQALDSGRTMIAALVTALHRDDAAMKPRLSELKRSTDAFDRKRPARQQAVLMEQYFRQAAALLRGLLETPPTAS